MSNRKVLIVDDDPQIRTLFGRVFEKAGYEPIAAASGEEALEKLKEQRTWVMFLDLNLPGMNGLELCRKIRDEYPLSIAHAVTGYGTLYELYDCREAGFEDYFLKPVDYKLLVEATEYAFKKIDRWTETG